MAQIKLQKTGENESSFTFTVVVEEGRDSTTHTVTVAKGDFNRLNYSSPEKLVHNSFKFLLQREPKESILSRFDLMDIGRYFPEYEKEIKKHGE